MPTLKSRLRSAANRMLRPLDLELGRPHEFAPPPPSRWTMEGMLQRARNNGIRPASLIDLGAARGDWSRLARRIFPEAAVLMVEPLEERRQALKQLGDEWSNTHFAPAVVGETAGEVTFHVTDDLDGSGIYTGDHGHPPRTVPCETLDSLVERHQLPAPFLVKFDTHGYELPILAGATRTLAETCAIAMEVYNFQISPTAIRFWDMARHLEELGFLCADLGDLMSRPGDGLLWQMDLLFLRKDHSCFQRQSYRENRGSESVNR